MINDLEDDDTKGGNGTFCRIYEKEWKCKELRSTKILKFGWMISLSSTIFVIYLNLTILIIYRVYIDAFIVGILNGKIE